MAINFEEWYIPTPPINTETEPPVRRLIMHCVSTHRLLEKMGGQGPQRRVP